ncbi:Ulp1 protease family protein [Seiridium cupressi]
MDMEKKLAAREAHHTGRTLAREVGAPYPRYKCAPRSLRTYRKKTNSFKAPNPHPARFKLPGRSGVVYPADTPSPEPTSSRKCDLSRQQTDDFSQPTQIIYSDNSHITPNFSAFAGAQIPLNLHRLKRIPGQPPKLDFRALCQPLPRQQEPTEQQQHLEQPQVGQQHPEQHHPEQHRDQPEQQHPEQQHLEQQQLELQRHLRIEHQLQQLNEQGLQPPQEQPAVRLAPRAMQTAMTVISSVRDGAIFVASLPCRFIRWSQGQPAAPNDPAVQNAPIQNVSLNSDGEEIPRREEIQAPKRRRVASREDGEAAQGEDDQDQDWTVRYRPSNGVTESPQDFASPQNGPEPANLVKDEEMVDVSPEPMTLAKDQEMVDVDVGSAGFEAEAHTFEEGIDHVPPYPPTPTQYTSPTHHVNEYQREERIEQDLHQLRLNDMASDTEKPTPTMRPGCRYKDMPEEWKNDMNATIQVYHETYDAAPAAAQGVEQVREKKESSYAEDQGTTKTADRTSFIRSKISLKRGPRYRNPRDFFDHEKEHSIPGVGELKPNLQRLAQDDEARKAREEKQRLEEEQRRRKEADAQLASLGLRTPHVPFITPLSQEWEDKVTASLLPGFKPVKTGAPESIELSYKDFSRMVPPTEWLNDNGIQAAIQYGADWINRSAGVRIKQDTPKCVALNSFFWSGLMSSGPRGKERMLKRVWGLTPTNFFSVDSIIIPINEHHHWTFTIIRPRRLEIAYVDSFHQPSPKRITKIRDFIAAFIGNNYKEKEWKETSFTIPRQTNGYDCGMFVITNSILLALGVDPSGYRQQDLPLQRRRIAAMILNGGFHGEFDLGKI